MQSLHACLVVEKRTRFLRCWYTSYSDELFGCITLIVVCHEEMYISTLLGYICYSTKHECPCTCVQLSTCMCFSYVCVFVIQPFLEEIYVQYKSLVTNDILVNAEKCSFIESLVMLRYLYIILCLLIYLAKFNCAKLQSEEI